jgi:hypothetical protein
MPLLQQVAVVSSALALILTQKKQLQTLGNPKQESRNTDYMDVLTDVARECKAYFEISIHGSPLVVLWVWLAQASSS